MEIKKIIAYIIVGLVFFIVGGGLGVLYQQQIIKKLSSDAITSIISSGTVENISGNEIILNANGISLPIKIKTDAKIYAPPLSEGEDNSQSSRSYREMSVEDIKAGDNLGIYSKLSSDGSLEAFKIFISSK
jgi:hypothetical protein